MKIVHLVLSESFAGIEQDVDEILSTRPKYRQLGSTYIP